MKSSPIFTIRPLPLPEESFSSYLSRLALANHVELVDVLYFFKKGSITHRKHLLDIFPSLAIDMKRLVSWTLEPESTFDGMSFAPLFKKFYSSEELKNFQSCNNLKKIVFQDKKRFCSLCLNEGSGYKLIWQISEIEMCDKHMTKLTSLCVICNTEQSYNQANAGDCYTCNKGHDLRNQIQVKEPFEDINDQLEKYNDWKFLLDSTRHIVHHPFDGLNRDQSLLVLLFYITQKNKSIFTFTKNPVLNDEVCRQFRRIIVTPEARNKISLDRFLSITREAGIPLEELSEIEVPNNFIRSIMESTPRMLCLAPWCKSFGTNNSIQKIHNNKRTSHNKVIFNNHSVCKSCWMRYGVDIRDKRWKPIDDMIEVIEKIKKPLTEDYSKSRICNEFNINKTQLLKVLGYMSQHDLLTEYQREKYTNNVQQYDDNLVDCFRRFIDKNGMCIGSNKMLGWNKYTFYYYLADPSVQEYLIFDANKDKQRSKLTTMRLSKYSKHQLSETLESTIQQFLLDDRTISRKSINEVTGIHIGTFERYGLNYRISESIKEQRNIRRKHQEEGYWRKASELIKTKEGKNESLTIKEVAELLGFKGTNWIYVFPGLHEKVSTRVKTVNNKLKENQIEKLKLQIEELFQSSDKISNEIIGQTLGVSYKTIFATFPEVFQHLQLLRYG